MAPIPYWENLFPDAAFGGLTRDAGHGGLVPRQRAGLHHGAVGRRPVLHPGLQPLRRRSRTSPNSTTRSRRRARSARSEYDALQLTLRQALQPRLSVRLELHFARGKDHASEVERGAAFGNFGSGGYSGFLVNSFDPDLNYSYSDFDVRHQINVNWLVRAAVRPGQGLGGERRRLHQRAHRRLGDRRHRPLVERLPVQRDQLPLVLGDELEPPGQRGARRPGRAAGDRDDEGRGRRPARARSPIRPRRSTPSGRIYPGETGIRNLLRGDGYFTIDMSLSKGFRLPFGQRLRFRWDVFNLTNTPRFDTGDVTMFPDIAPRASAATTARSPRATAPPAAACS